MKRLLLPVLFFLFFIWQHASAQCPPPGYPAPGDICAVAPVLCTNLDGYCATLGTNNVQQTFPGCPSNVLNNDEWFGFIAGSTSITIEVVPSNCQGTNGQFGMQAAILEGNCSGAAVATQCDCVQGTFQMSYNNFFVGQAYYIVFDGCAGDICDFQVNVLDGSTLPVPPDAPGPILGPLNVCPGATSNYTLTNPTAATYDWTLVPPSVGSFNGIPQGGDVDITWNTIGTAQLCVTASNPCFANPDQSCITITSANIPQTVLPPMNLCVGDCVVCAGETFCAPTGPNGIPVTLTSWLGCDSVVVCKINGIPPINNNIGQVTHCAPYTFNICGTAYTASEIITQTCPNASWQGCDSTVIVDLAILNPEVVISPPPVLLCGAGATVTLTGINSTLSVVPGGNLVLQWTGPGIVGPSNQITCTVNQPGTYCLNITVSRNGVTCTDQACVTVTQNNAVPQIPQISGNQMPCQGTTVNYTVTPVGTPAPTSYTWTTPNGETVTQVNPTTVSVNWSNAAGGQLCVTANNSCGASGPACLPITITAAPVQPTVTGPATVCANNQTQTYTISPTQPGVTYTWTVPAGASFTGSGASITVNFNGTTPGSGQVCATAMNSCGTSQAGCAPVTITAAPATPVLNGPASVCSSGGGYNYSVASPQAGVMYNWTAPPGATVNGNGPMVSIDFNGATTGQVCVSASNSCGNSQQACQNVQVAQAPAATISGAGAFCQGSGGSVNLSISLTGTGPWTVAYSINNGTPIPVNITTSPYTLVATQAGTYTLTSVTGANNCSGTVTGTGTVTQNPSPAATLSGTGSICQGSGQQVPLTVTLTGTAPWTVNWTVDNNAQAPLVINTSPYTLNIGQAQAGTVELTNVTDGNGCPGTASGSATVTVNTAPTVSMVSTPCDALNENFTVSFTINGGNPATYSVTPLNGTLTGNMFVSNPIPSGNGYSFVVADANGCSPVTVSEPAVICDCGTAVGSMDLAPVEECGNGPVTVTYDTSGQEFDGNDILVFILHSGNSVNIVPPIHSVSTSPTVSFNPATMTYGTTYYLSAVVGDEDAANNSVVLTDPCLAVAQGTPITFNEVPTAALSGDPAVCEGDPANLTVEFTGESPWSISYDDGNGNIQTVNGITSQPYTLVVNPGASSTYCLTAMSDVNCPGNESGCADVTVNTGVQYSNLDVACNATSTAYTITFNISGGDPSSYTVTGVPGTINNGIFTSNELPTGTGFSLVLDDANGCDPQTIAQTQVICNCTTEAGQMDPQQVDECGNGPVTFLPATGSELDADDIQQYILHTGSSNNIGTMIAASDAPIFGFDNTTMMYGETYYVSSVVGTDDGTGNVDMTDPCLSIAPGTPVVFYEIPTATLSGGSEICPGESAELMIELTGDSPWSVTINGQDITGIIGTPYAYTVTPGTTTVYNLTGVQDEHCPNTATGSETVTVHQPPVIDDVDVDCNPTGTGYTVTIDISAGDPACYQVTPNTGTLTGNQFVSDMIPDGQGYLFQVTDCHGCPAEVTEDPSVDCSCITLVGNMDATPLSICGNQMSMPIYNDASQVLDPDDVLCFMLHNGDEQPINTNATGQFSFNPGTMTYGQQYFIAALVGTDDGNGCVDFNDNCLSISNSVPVTYYAIPTAMLSGDASICAGESTNLTIQLTGVAPWTIEYENAAGTPVTVTASSSPHTIAVNPSSSNVYGLLSLTDAHCTGTVSGSAIVTVNNPPDAVNETTDCDATGTTYTVSFENIGDDNTSYTVAPTGIINAGVFTSNPIVSGQPYTFQVDDANGCGPTLVEGIRICDCTTDAGTMSTVLTNVCVGQTAMGTPLAQAVLDANDILVYILHTNSGNQLGTVIATSNTPSFMFNPATMTTGTQYYISAVVGDNNGSGGVLVSDPCLSVAPGTPVIFRALPTISISGTTAVCEGETVTVSMTLTGSGPFDVAYLENGTAQTIQIPLAGDFTFDVTPIATTTFTLVSTTDVGTGCSNTSTQSATITVNEPVSAGSSIGDLDFCQGVNQTIDLDNQLTGADAGGQWSGPSGLVPGGTVSINSLSPGVYPYTYTVTGVAPCPNDAELVTITIAAQPVADAGPDQELNCDVLSVELGSDNTTTTGTTIQWTGGNVSDPASAKPVVTEPGIYTLTVSNSTGCSDSDVVEVTQSITTPDPHITISDVSCFGDSDGYIVIDSITDGNPPYLCSFDGSAFTPAKQFSNLNPGQHTLIILDASGCETELIFTVGEPQEVTVEIEGSFEGSDPVIDLGESVVLQIITTPPFQELDTVVWSNGGVDSCTTCQQITVMPNEQSTFSVMIEKDGCRDDDKITVFVQKNRPVYVPNAFSPNEDGVNDFFSVFAGASVARIKSFLVFNRWGETIYEYYDFAPNDPLAGWDGTHRGEELNPGVFTWFAEIEFTDGSSEIYEGDVSLMR